MGLRQAWYVALPCLPTAQTVLTMTDTITKVAYQDHQLMHAVHAAPQASCISSQLYLKARYSNYMQLNTVSSKQLSTAVRHC